MDVNKTTILKALGFLVRQHRENLALSQEELAIRSGLDRTYISGIERGVRNPSLTALVSLAEGMQMNLAHLLDGLESRMDTQDDRTDYNPRSTST